MEQEVLDVKMLLESLSDIVNEMGGCSMKVDYRNPSRVSKFINGIEDLHDSVKAPILVGELSITGNPSLLVFYVGISGYKIEMNPNNDSSETLLCSKKGSPRGDILSPYYFFYDQCVSTSYILSRKKICDEIKEKETVIENNENKKEYNGNNDKATLKKLNEELVKFDEKFSKYKK